VTFPATNSALTTVPSSVGLAQRLRDDEKQIHEQKMEIQQLRQDVSSILTPSTVVPRVTPQRRGRRVCTAYDIRIKQEIRNCEEADMGLCAHVINNLQDRPCPACKYDLSQAACSNLCRGNYGLVDFNRDFGECTSDD
jgi:hypothetical protein